MSSAPLVWIDCEMTGLDLEHDALVEIAVLVTDGELNVLGEGVDVVIRPPDASLEQMPDVVREMHTASGLLDELADRHHARRRRGAGPGLHPRARPRAAQGAAGRQLGRHRPRLHRPRHARAGRPPALPDRRRLARSRSWPGGGTRGPTSRRPPSTAATARWPTSSRASRSCGTTGRRSSCPPPARTRDARDASRRGTGGSAQPDSRRAPTGAGSRTGPPGDPVHSLLPTARRGGGHGGCSSAGRAPGCGPGGRGFKSRHSPHVSAGQSGSKAAYPEPHWTWSSSSNTAL